MKKILGNSTKSPAPIAPALTARNFSFTSAFSKAKTVLARGSLLLLFSAAGWSSTSFAFDGQIEFASKLDGIEHKIRLSNWQQSKKEISFEYEYQHSGSNCSFHKKAKVSAVLDSKGKPSMETWLDDSGKPIGRSMIFSGDDESINFPAKKAELLKFFGYGLQLPKDAAQRGCLKNARDIDLVFRNGTVK